MDQVLRGHYGSAISHLTSGARILEESVLKDDSTTSQPVEKSRSFPYVPRDNLLVLFNRLYAQVQQVSLPPATG